ncbi:MAG: gliding motility-associated ABC transporter ATP-binding subunit GldA [Capnocytophaga sp.]|nr:gliding motility-associated ABC transporter ATP-binding subunit GldA [Capnocytophaga sp.]
MSVEIKQLTKQYGNQTAVNAISFELRKGEITGFLGPNGAGKSTTMKMITGGLIPTQGTISIDGIAMTANTVTARKKIGYLPENNPLYLEMYVLEYLKFMSELNGGVPKSRIDEVLQIVGLQEQSHKRIGQLSKGYRQRVGLAAALVHDPEILILDEPTTGLDPNQLAEIRHIIKELGKEKTILLSSHIMQEIQAVCQRVIVLHKGTIVLDKPLKDLQNKEQVIEVAFDLRVEERLLRSIPSVKSVENIHEFLYLLTFDTEADKRSVVFDFANANGLKIMQMNHRHKDLEQLFAELTKK